MVLDNKNLPGFKKMTNGPCHCPLRFPMNLCSEENLATFRDIYWLINIMILIMAYHTLPKTEYSSPQHHPNNHDFFCSLLTSKWLLSNTHLTSIRYGLIFPSFLLLHKTSTRRTVRSMKTFDFQIRAIKDFRILTLLEIFGRDFFLAPPQKTQCWIDQRNLSGVFHFRA